MTHPFDRLITTMDTLRGENGCPWDREQDHHSLKRYLIEEAYEVLDAIDAADDENLAEELGDVLLQVIFHSQIASETGRFDVYDVVNGLHDKLIRRHPHVFSDVRADNVEDVLASWEKIKAEENKSTEGEQRGKQTSLMDKVSKGLPALLRALHVQRVAAKVGFDWANTDGVIAKVTEEANELLEAFGSMQDVSDPTDGAPPSDAIVEEWGDLFFALVNAARHMGVDPEEATRQATLKFERRFRGMEQQAAAHGKLLENMSLEEQDALWDEQKRRDTSESV